MNLTKKIIEIDNQHVLVWDSISKKIHLYWFSGQHRGCTTFGSEHEIKQYCGIDGGKYLFLAKNKQMFIADSVFGENVLKQSATDRPVETCYLHSNRSILYSSNDGKIYVHNNK